MGLEPTSCPDCSYPPNFICTALPKENSEDTKQRFDVRCRDCGDFWIEEVDEESN